MSNANSLPRAWVRASLEAITLPQATCNPSRDRTGVFQYVDIDALDNTRQTITAPKELTVGEAPSRARMLIHEGDVLFSLVRPYLKNIAIVPASLNRELASTAYYVLRPGSGIDTRFLYYQVMQDAFIDSVPTYGNSPPSARDDEFVRIEVAVAPSKEQRRIADEIEKQFTRLGAGVAALKRVEANLKRYKAAVLKAAVEGRLTEKWRAEHPDVEPASELLKRILTERRRRWEQSEITKMQAKGKPPTDDRWKTRYQEPAAPKTDSTFELPSLWTWTCLGQCFEVHVGATPSRIRPEYWNGEIPWVSSGEVQFCRIMSTKETITKAGLANSSTQINPVGSVLLNMIGEGATRGKAGILGIAAANNQNCAAVWVPQTPVLPEFLFYWLTLSYSKTRRIGSGNNQPALNKTLVERIVFPLPPLNEQQVIVCEVEENLSSLAAAEETTTTAVRRASRLRQSILKRAFEGRLVPQDPTDEPASVLIDGICAERQSAGAPVRNGPKKQSDEKPAKKALT